MKQETKNRPYSNMDVDKERQDRVGNLTGRQARIALMVIAQTIAEKVECDTVSFYDAIEIAKTYE